MGDHSNIDSTERPLKQVKIATGEEGAATPVLRQQGELTQGESQACGDRQACTPSALKPR